LNLLLWNGWSKIVAVCKPPAVNLRLCANVALLVSLTIGLLQPATSAQTANQEFLTVAESSGFKATSKFDDVVAFVDRCAREAAHVQRIDIGETVEGRPMVAAIVGNPLPNLEELTESSANQPSDDRIVCLLLGNIHSGECAGKEALLMLLRELALTQNSPLLEKMVIIIVPNYNADANERIGPGENHRPGQLGPEQGMGLRENAQQLDLNRDFVKLEAPETRALVRLMNQYDVDLFIDCHTTNGSKHRYDLTYDFPHNPAVFPDIKQFLLSELLPSVTQTLSDKGIETFFYGNFDRKQTEWRTFGYEGRYSTEHAGLANRIGILSEAYSYVSYERRIQASREFVRECLLFAAKNPDRIKQIRSQAKAWGRTAFEKNEMLPMSATLEAFPEKVLVKGFQDDTPADLEVSWYSNFRPAEKAGLPYAYLIPQEFSQVVDRLVMQGITVHQLDKTLHTEVLIDRCAKLTRPDRAFQGHRLVSLESTRRSEVRDIPAKTFVVPVNQPYARLLATLLEPNSVDSFYTWNFFDDQIAEGQDLPVTRLDEKVDWEVTDVQRVEPSELLTLAKIDGPIGQINLESGVRSAPEWFDNDHYLIDWNTRRFKVNVVSGAMEPAVENTPTRLVINKLVNLLQKNTTGAKQPDDQPVAIRSQDLVFSIDRMQAVVQVNNDLYIAQGEPLIARQLTSDGIEKSLIEFSPNGKWISYVDANHNLKAVATQSEQQLAFTSDGSPTIFNGQLDWVYQEELYGRGNFKGYWWNSQSTHISFLRLDETEVPKFDVVDHLPVHNGIQSTAYPKAGDPNPVVQLGIGDLSGQVQWADVPNQENVDTLITSVSWDRSGQNVVFQVQNRQQTWLDLCQVPAFGGPAKVIFRDQTPAWIRSPGPPHWLLDGSFLWLSPRSGWQQIYHYNADGTLRTEITKPEIEVQEILGLSPAEDQVFFSACYPSPTEKHVHRVTLSGGLVNRLTSLGTSHKVKFNETFSYFIDEAGSVTSPSRMELRSSDGKRIRVLETRIDDRLNYLKVNPPELIKVPTSDGSSLEAYLIRPADFDSSKKYPILFHVYGGPQNPKVQNVFGGRTYLWHQYLAQQGICVWICDNRSATHNASKWAWPIHKNLGENELKDIQEGLNWLNAQEWVDQKQIGIWGWSYGGYMTAYAMTHSPAFKVGISGAPVTDWQNYDSIYTERYMGLPSENPEGYRNSSCVEAAANLNGHLLLIHGGMDDNVHINNTMQFVKALQDAGKPFEMMIYPDNRHSITNDNQVRHMRSTMTNYLMRHLKVVDGKND